jgi:hypothetical protein
MAGDFAQSSMRCAFLAVREGETQDAIESGLPKNCPGEMCRALRIFCALSASGCAHPLDLTTETIPESLSPEIEIIRVGRAESWRHGLRIVMRQSMIKKI